MAGVILKEADELSACATGMEVQAAEASAAAAAVAAAAAEGGEEEEGALADGLETEGGLSGSLVERVLEALKVLERCVGHRVLHSD